MELILLNKKPLINFNKLKDLFINAEGDDEKKGDEMPGWANKLLEAVNSLKPSQTEEPGGTAQIPVPEAPPAEPEPEPEPEEPPAPPAEKKQSFLSWLF